MGKTYELTTEFFAIPHEAESYLLYSPLKQVLMLANDEMVDLVASLEDGSFRGVNGDNMDAMQLLIESGCVNGPADEPPQFQAKSRWAPTDVTLFLTNACNLRCTYCYASGGDFQGTMEVETAVRAVETVIQNAVAQAHGEVRVSFHGGGEPTLAWPALTAAVEAAERLAAKHGLDLFISLATNGVLPDWKVDWLVKHVHDFSISYDGPSWMQDFHRPTASGNGSAETVEATLRHLDSHHAAYGIRVTVSRDTVAHLEEMVNHLLRRFSPRTLHMEPLFTHGRAQSNGLQSPDAYDFIANYRKAQQAAAKYGMELYYSGARIGEITDTFCAVPSGSFNVTPQGQLTACYEVCHPEDDLASEFFYGEMNKETDSFDVSQRHLDKLAQHTVRERPECEACFCKWHCAGDCIAKNLTSDREAEPALKSVRCTINQELSRDQLLAKFKSNSKIMSQVESGRTAELIRLGPTSPPPQTPASPSLPLVQLSSSLSTALPALH